MVAGLIDEGRKAIYASTVNGDRLLAFDLAGKRKPDVNIGKCCTKAVLMADSGYLALAQFDFTDAPNGWNVATIPLDKSNKETASSKTTRYMSRPSLCTAVCNDEGCTDGFNHEVFGSVANDELHFMTTFCDTLFRYDTRTGSIVPELAVNVSGRRDECGLFVIALPRHYLINIMGSNAQEIIVDKERMTATRASIVCGDSLDLRFANGYAYAVLPPDGKNNATIVRWRLSGETTSGEKHSDKTASGKSGKHAKLSMPQPVEGKLEIDTKAADHALDLSRHGQTDEAMRVIDRVIAKAGAKRGHPALAYAYMVKSVLFTQMEQTDSAEAYRLLVNAPLTLRQQRDINERLMHIHIALGNYDVAQRYAVAYGSVSDMAQGSQYYFEITENRERISTLNEQADSASRTRTWLWAALAAVVVIASAVILILRHQRRKQIVATRHELQALMEQRIEALTADKERSIEAATADKEQMKREAEALKAEIMKNHAIIRRISKASRPLSDSEEDLLHRITEMLYPGLTDRLQTKATTPLSKRDLTICFLIRLGVPQLSIATLLDIKPASFRVAKSNLKRDRFRLPVEAELEEFICGV